MAEILPIRRKTQYNQSINGQTGATNDQVSANINHYDDIIRFLPSPAHYLSSNPDMVIRLGHFYTQGCTQNTRSLWHIRNSDSQRFPGSLRQKLRLLPVLYAPVHLAG